MPTAEHRLPSTRSLSGEQQRTLSRGPQPFNCSMLNEAMWPQPYCSHGNVLLDIFFFLLQTVSPLTVLDTADAISPVVRTGHHPELLQGTSPAIFLWPWPIAAHPGRAGRMAPSWTIHSLHEVTPCSFHAGSRCVTAVTRSHPSGARWPFIVFFETLVCYNLCLD